jgi:hypothetical protein
MMAFIMLLCVETASPINTVNFGAGRQLKQSFVRIKSHFGYLTVYDLWFARTIPALWCYTRDAGNPFVSRMVLRLGS